MGVPQPKPRLTPEDYFRLERDSTVKHEYHDGEILAMAGASTGHGLIAMNVGGELRQRLKGKPCRVFDSSVRIRAGATSRYAYADATVICGPIQFDPADSKNETALNPRVIIEVLSPSTEAYDRGEKFEHYRELESLQEYVLVSQTKPLVEIFFRQSDGSWLINSADDLTSSIRLHALDIDLPLSEVYAGVEFPPAPPPPDLLGLPRT